MVLNVKRIGALTLRLIVGLALLGWPRVGAAQGTWSVISLPPQPGEVLSPTALAVDTAGNLYVASDGIQKRDAQGNWSVFANVGSSRFAVDGAGNLYLFGGPIAGGAIQKRDVQGNWSVIASSGDGLGQVAYQVAGLAADGAGNLYVADWGRIQKRDAQEHWSVVAIGGYAPGQVYQTRDLAVDGAGNLYVADWDFYGYNRIQKRDTQGHWSAIATSGNAGFYPPVRTLAADGAGNLYVAEVKYDNQDQVTDSRIQKRDVQGNWSVIATSGSAVGQVSGCRGLAADAAGNLYVADGYNRIQKRDAQGNWSVIPTYGSVPGQLLRPWALVVDAAGNLYVADQGQYPNYVGRIQKRDAQGNWSVIDTLDLALDPGWFPTAFAADRAGNLYFAEWIFQYDDDCNFLSAGRIQQRDAQGNWSVIANWDWGPGANYPTALAVDAAGNLYVADAYNRIRHRDVQGNWFVIAPTGSALGQVGWVGILAVDAAGNLYVDDGYPNYRFQKRDAQGNWSVIAIYGPAVGQVSNPLALAVNAAGDLYVAEYPGRIQKRDAQGNWSVFALYGSAVGQVASPSGLAVDGAGNLYVADTGNNRVLEYAPHP